LPAALALIRRQMRQTAAQALIADDLGHAEYLRGDRGATPAGDVCIAPLSIQDR